ncbi:hypothetical protein [Xanthomonas cerealis]|uniref:hypothetical protein n=1 Tax=Xanthomonas cerealis TaxID=3390025 RepID=UPI0005792510|nr:hypothetical protein [Xanthomonas translucens]UKE46233.1 hypothetical protein KHA79_14010 [Xanthomonas translucens pv. cerealis]
MSTAPTDAMTDLLAARDQRRAKLAGHRPTDHQPQQKDAFDGSLAKDQSAIQEKQQAVLDWAKQAKPEEIAAFRDQMDSQAKERAQAAPEDKHAQVVFSTVDEWRQRRQQKDGGQQQGEAPPMLTAAQRQQSMGPGKLGYANFAASAKKEAEFMRDYEAKFDWSQHEAQAQKNIYRQ